MVQVTLHYDAPRSVSMVDYEHLRPVCDVETTAGMTPSFLAIGVHIVSARLNSFVLGDPPRCAMSLAVIQPGVGMLD